MLDPEGTGNLPQRKAAIVQAADQTQPLSRTLAQLERVWDASKFPETNTLLRLNLIPKHIIEHFLILGCSVRTITSQALEKEALEIKKFTVTPDELSIIEILLEELEALFFSNFRLSGPLKFLKMAVGPLITDKLDLRDLLRVYLTALGPKRRGELIEALYLPKAGAKSINELY